MAAEGNIVGEVGLIVKPVDPGFNAGVQKIIDKIERDAQFKVAADTQQAQAALQGLDTQVSSINNGLVQSAINVAGITAAFYALKGAANQVIGKFSGLFDQLAQAKAGFSSILKSENAGNNLLADIQEFARVSPFVTQELVNYSQQLLGVGLSAEKIVPLLEDVGNIISSVGGDTQNMGRVLFTLTQIQSIGRLAGQDAMQLQSSLIPITKYLSEFLGKTTAEVKKLQEQGKISAETVFQAIQAQGDKVEGAMDKATRNIAGARAILGDTITLMLQNQPVLDKIFKDIFQGILAFSNYLGTDEVQQTINEFFEGVNKIYESLKPLVASISDLSAGVGMSSLKALTSVLQLFADTISAIPEPMIKLLAAFFVGMSAVKAPLMLLKYVQNLKNLSAGVLQAGISIGKGTAAMNEQTIAAERTAAAVRDLTAAQQGYSNAGAGILSGGVSLFPKLSKLGGTKIPGGASTVGLGLATAGAMVGDGNGGARDVVGNIAQYAGMGAMIGGPWGAAAGGAVGAITSIVTASRNAAAEIKKHAQKAADSWANEIQTQIKAQYGDASNPQAITAFLTEATKGENLIATYERHLKRLTDAKEGARGRDLLNDKEWIDQFKRTNEVLANLRLEQEALFKDSEYKDYLDSAAAKLALVADALPDQVNLATRGLRPGRSQEEVDRRNDLLTGRVSPENLDELDTVNSQLKSWGITLEDLVTKTKEQVVELVQTFTQMPDAIRDALKATNEWNQRLADAKAISDTLWSPDKQKIGAIMAYNTAVQNALDAQTRAAYNSTDANAQLAAQQQLLTLKQEEYNRVFADTKSKTEAAAAAEYAYQLAIRFRNDAVEAAEVSTRLQREDTINQLLEMSGIADTLDNRQLIIDVGLAGVEEVLGKIEEVQTKLLDLKNMALPEAESRDLRGQYNSELYQLRKQRDELANGGGGLVDKIKAEEEKRNGERRRREAEEAAKRAAEEAKRAAEEARQAAERWAAQVESATNSMTQAVTNAAQQIADAAKSWVGSIKERTQYEQAVSASRLTRNADRQIADVAELQAGINNLKSRGLSQAMLDALGIDNVSDTRQVRKLVNASDADLAALAASMSNLDSAATTLAQQQEDKRQRDNITAAIVEAAKQLDIKIGKEQAAGIANNFTITPGTNAEDVALQILNILTSGRIGV